MKRILCAALAVAAPVAAVHAAALVVTKSSTIVADQVNLLNPKAIPNATLDYAIRVDNPNGLFSGNTVGAVVIEDVIPATVALRVADYGPIGSGPVEFADGGLLGLLGSGLGYSFAGLGSTSDGIAFSNGTTWAYTPVADAAGYDANVRAIRVRLTGTQAPASSFRLRFRVRLK